MTKMKQLKNIEKVTNLYPAWRPSDIAFIKRLEWSNGNIELTTYSQLRNEVLGWPDTTMDFIEVTLVFKYVTNLKLELVSRIVQQITGFDIIDISNNGLEKINYQIEDYEGSIIGFYCEEIEITEVIPSVRLTIG